MKKYYLISIILFWFNSIHLFSQLLNPGFEAETGTTITDWTNNGTGTASVGTANARTGANAISYTTSSFSIQDMRSNSTIPIPNNYYCHVIGWVKGGNSTTWASIGTIIGSSQINTAVDAPGTTFKRYYIAWQNNQGSTQNAVVKLNSASGSGTTTLYWDDIVMYSGASATVDVVDPNFTGTLTATSNTNGTSITINGIQGTDASSGVRGAVVLRANGLAQTPPVLNDQGRYSTLGGSNGPNTIDSWTVVGVLEQGVQSFVDNSVTPNTDYTYAAYIRDDAYNYSTPGTTNVTALPVELTSFTALVKNNLVNLKWQTITEVNNYGFEIEKCQKLNAKGETWEKIGFVEGHGNSNSPKDYYFIDKYVPSGEYAYRLKQIDADGKFEYSSSIKVEVLPNQYELMQNYPNPANPTTKIMFSLPYETELKIGLYNILGESIRTIAEGKYNAGFHQVELMLSDLVSGIYIYKLESKNFSNTKKLILLK
jgi:hypothetical protein